MDGAWCPSHVSILRHKPRSKPHRELGHESTCCPTSSGGRFAPARARSSLVPVRLSPSLLRALYERHLCLRFVVAFAFIIGHLSVISPALEVRCPRGLDRYLSRSHRGRLPTAVRRANRWVDWRVRSARHLRVVPWWRRGWVERASRERLSDPGNVRTRSVLVPGVTLEARLSHLRDVERILVRYHDPSVVCGCTAGVVTAWIKAANHSHATIG